MNFARRSASCFFLMISLFLAACGGGEDEKVSYPANYLTKYQGTWIVQCSAQIPYGMNTFGPSSIREKIVFSAPDAAGKVTIEVIQEYFDTTLSCYNYTGTPYAVIKNILPLEALMDREASLPAFVGRANYDVLKVTQRASELSATGTGISSTSVNGTPAWRITFPDGKTVDRNAAVAAASGELALLIGLVNGGAIIELNVYGNTNRYVKQ